MVAASAVLPNSGIEGRGDNASDNSVFRQGPLTLGHHALDAGHELSADQVGRNQMATAEQQMPRQVEARMRWTI
jgi:hypothetical protein